jgi:hypothetical protein
LDDFGFFENYYYFFTSVNLTKFLITNLVVGGSLVVKKKLLGQTEPAPTSASSMDDKWT